MQTGQGLLTEGVAEDRQPSGRPAFLSRTVNRLLNSAWIEDSQEGRNIDELNRLCCRFSEAVPAPVR